MPRTTQVYLLKYFAKKRSSINLFLFKGTVTVFVNRVTSGVLEDCQVVYLHGVG